MLQGQYRDRRRRISVWGRALLVVFVLCAGPAWSGSPGSLPPAKLLPEEQATVDVFQRAAPAVVFIKNAALQWDLFSISALEVPRGAGSGFIWDTDGHIVTNFHVVYRADRIDVILSDKKAYSAAVVGLAPNYDIAVLKIDAPKELLKTIPLGNSKALKVGQRALSIGNPFGLDYSLTTGVVSALGRSMPSIGGRNIYDVIQTDAAINPGNSGGPLLDSSGNLIGIATMIFSPSGGSAGVGFAVPVDTVKRVVPELIKYGRLKRVGLNLVLLPESVREQLGLPGAVVLEVQPGGPAGKAGLRGTTRDVVGNIVFGDVIIAVNNIQIRDNDDFLRAMEGRKAGDRIVIKYWRKQKTFETTAVVEELS